MEHRFSILIRTPREIAARRKWSANLVRKMIDNCELPAFQSGGKLLRIHLCDLEAYEEAQGTVRLVFPLEAMLGRQGLRWSGSRPPWNRIGRGHTAIAEANSPND
jgi:hypothetical protein